MSAASTRPLHRAGQPPASHADRSCIEPRERLLLAASGVLLSIAFISGGSSQEYGWGVMAAELLALVVILFVLSQPAWRARLAAARWGLAVACLIVAIPLLQLLPIPAWLWQWPAPRAALQHDLAAAGVAHISHRWSLAPAATERDLYLLLPGLVMFLVALATRREAWRVMLRWLFGLIVFSVVLAFAQLGVPQDSVLNPFPQYVPTLAGVFANHNHQACALAMGLVLALVFLCSALRRVQAGKPAHPQAFAWATLAVLLATIVPIVGSRAGVIIGIVGAAITILACGTWSPQKLRSQRLARWIAALVVIVLAIGLYGAFAWVGHDTVMDTLRPQMAAATARLADANMPLGAGAGSFVRLFEQFTHGSLMWQESGYINAAHNDYLQWWYAGGVLAIVAAMTAAAALTKALVSLLQLPRESGLRTLGMAALLAMLMPLLHSTVDYPLRTPALMTVFGMLAGIAVGAGVHARQRRIEDNRNPARGPSKNKPDFTATSLGE